MYYIIKKHHASQRNASNFKTYNNMKNLSS